MPRIKNIALGLDRQRRDLDQSFGELRLAADLHFGFEEGDTRGIRRAAGTDFTKI